MHITSTINPLSKSDGNIAVGVFRYNDQRKFLRVSEDHTVCTSLRKWRGLYLSADRSQEMVSLVKRAFSIDSGSILSLHISSLDACRGQSVEVDESAYSLMYALLDDVEVTVKEPSSTQGVHVRFPT